MPSSFMARSWSSVGCFSIQVSSVEVRRATDVVVNDRRPVRGGLGPLAIALGLQDRLHRRERARADLQCSRAGCLQPLGAIALGEPNDADAGAEALLGMFALAQNDLDERGCA